MPDSPLSDGPLAAVDTTEATRRCWRCLASFPADPDEPATAHATWWLCASCHDALIGGSTSSARH